RIAAARDGVLVHRFMDLTEPVRYYATAGDGLSDTGAVEVVDPPAILNAGLTYHFPAYMELPPEQIRSASPGIAAPLGSTVDLALRATKPLRSVRMTLAGRPPVSWLVSGETVRGSIPVRQDGSYSLQLVDADGFANPQPITFPIKSIADQTPEVQ